MIYDCFQTLTRILLLISILLATNAYDPCSSIKKDGGIHTLSNCEQNAPEGLCCWCMASNPVEPDNCDQQEGMCMTIPCPTTSPTTANPTTANPTTANPSTARPTTANPSTNIAHVQTSPTCDCPPPCGSGLTSDSSSAESTIANPTTANPTITENPIELKNYVPQTIVVKAKSQSTAVADPTPQPTQWPTPKPTIWPTAKPTAWPTREPIAALVQVPTVPTGHPSGSGTSKCRPVDTICECDVIGISTSSGSISIISNNDDENGNESEQIMYFAKRKKEKTKDLENVLDYGLIVGFGVYIFGSVCLCYLCYRSKKHVAAKGMEVCDEGDIMV